MSKYLTSIFVSNVFSILLIKSDLLIFDSVEPTFIIFSSISSLDIRSIKISTQSSICKCGRIEFLSNISTVSLFLIFLTILFINISSLSITPLPYRVANLSIV